MADSACLPGQKLSSLRSLASRIMNPPSSGRGGARRQAPANEPSVEQTIYAFNAYVDACVVDSTEPFDWGVYATLTPAKAVVPSALVLALRFVEEIVAIAPSRELSSKTFKAALSHVVTSKLRLDYRHGHKFWRNCDPMDSSSLKMFVTDVWSSVLTVLHHVRRLSRDSDARHSCMSCLASDSRKSLRHVLNLIRSEHAKPMLDDAPDADAADGDLDSEMVDANTDGMEAGVDVPFLDASVDVPCSWRGEPSCATQILDTTPLADPVANVDAVAIAEKTSYADMHFFLIRLGTH